MTNTDPLHYAKGIIAVLGAGITAALGLIPEGDTAWVILTIAAAMITALGVIFVPNKPDPVPVQPTQLPA